MSKEKILAELTSRFPEPANVMLVAIFWTQFQNKVYKPGSHRKKQRDY